MRYREIITEISALPKYDRLAYKQARKIAPPEISDQQRSALKWYRGFGSEEINSELRKLPLRRPAFTDAEKQEEHDEVLSTEETIQRIDSVMLKAPKRNKVLAVYRGEADAERVASLQNMEIGQSYVDDAFLSTSLGPSYAFYSFAAARGKHNVLSMIRLPVAVQGIYVSDLDGSDEHTELEFLINRGTRYTLRDRRTIPNRNRGYSPTVVQLLVWDAEVALYF